jgi:predicted nucleotidyltransferase
MPISPEALAAYRRTARERWLHEQQERTARRADAWQAAHEAARVLREQFGVQQVVVFGSLVHPGRFTLRSDVDLAAWGLTDANWLAAVGAVHQLYEQFDLNLVDLSTCSPELLAVIERDGVAV